MKQTAIEDFHIKQQENKCRGAYGWGQKEGERRWAKVKRESKTQPRSVQLIKEGIRQVNYLYWNICITRWLPGDQPSGCAEKYIYMLISLYFIFCGILLWFHKMAISKRQFDKNIPIRSSAKHRTLEKISLKI